MDWIIFVTGIFLLFVIFYLAKTSVKKLLAHIKKLYPDEWRKLNATKLGVKPSEVFQEAIGTSMKHGFLSKQNDAQLVKLYKKYKLFNNLTLGIFLIDISS